MSEEQIKTTYKGFNIEYCLNMDKWHTCIGDTSFSDSSLTAIRAKLDAHIKRENKFAPITAYCMWEGYRGTFGRVGKITSIDEKARCWFTDAEGNRSRYDDTKLFAAANDTNRALFAQISSNKEEIERLKKCNGQILDSMERVQLPEQTEEVTK